MTSSELHSFLLQHLTTEIRKNCLDWKPSGDDPNSEYACSNPSATKRGHCFCALEADRYIAFIVEKAAGHGWKFMPVS